MLKLIKKQWRTYSIKGNNVFCPICKSYFRSFGNGGMDSRPGAKCHNCGSLERHRLVFRFMDKELNMFNSSMNLNILHFAPEPFFYKKFSKMPNVDYLPCDLDVDTYLNLKPIPVKKVDMTNTLLEGNKFDFILCIHVLEHIPKVKNAMSELYRILKTGGRAILQVPIDYSLEQTYEDFSITQPQERLKAFGQHDHVRWFGRDYKDKLGEVGFIVSEVDYANQHSEEDIKKFGLTPHEKIYSCIKN